MLKKQTAFRLIAVFIILGASPLVFALNQVGETATNFTLNRWETTTAVSLYDYADHVIVLDFFAWTCGYCRAASEELELYVQQYYDNLGGNPAGIPVKLISLEINGTNHPATNAWIAQYGLELVLDDSSWTAFTPYGQVGTPRFVVINGASEANYGQWEVLYNNVYAYHTGDYMNFRALINSVTGPYEPSDPPTDDANTKGLWHMDTTEPNPDYPGFDYVPDDTSVRGGDGKPLYMMDPLATAGTEPTVNGGVMTFDGINDVAYADNAWSYSGWSGDTSTVSVDFSFKAAATSDGDYEHMIGTYGNWRICLESGTATLKAYAFPDGSDLTDAGKVWIGSTQIARGVWYDAHFEIDENLMMSLSVNDAIPEQVQLTAFNTGTTYSTNYGNDGNDIVVGGWPERPTYSQRNFAGSLDEVKVSGWWLDAISDLRVTFDDEQISLDWTNPTDPNFTGVKIQQKTGSYPTGPTDGTTLYNGAGTNADDTSLTNGTTYYYRAFSYDADSNYSSVASAVAGTPKTLGCGDWGYLPADIYPDSQPDCHVDLLDFSLLAQQWLGCTGDDCGGLADLALGWLACTDPSNGACGAGDQQQIVGESLVLSGTLASTFLFDQIVEGNVQARSDEAPGTGTSYYQEGVDYVIDYAQGTVARTAGSAIPDGSTVWFDYTTNSMD